MDDVEAGLLDRVRSLEQENGRLAAELERYRNAKQGDGVAQQIYRAIGETIPYGIWVTDPDGRATYASQSLLDMLGVTMQQYADDGWGDSVHPDDIERVAAAWREHVRKPDGPIWETEHRLRGKDGKYRTILARGVPVRDEHGRITCWAGINLDISLLRQAEEELSLSRQRFELALKNSDIVVFMQDRDLRYTWVYNPALGVRAADVLGKTDETVGTVVDAGELTAAKRQVIESGVGQRRDFLLTGQDGVARTFDTTMEPLRDASGKVVGLVAASVDVTETQRQQQEVVMSAVRTELRHQLEAERERARQSLSHDVHAGPLQRLSALNMMVDVARMTAQDEAVSVELQEFRAELKETIRELRDVVGTARLDAPRTAGLGRWMAIYVRAFQREHPELDVSYRAGQGRRTVSEDADLVLLRALAEALRNIERHAHAKRVAITLSYRQDDAALEVWDDGAGMSAPANLHLGRGLAAMRERLAALGGRLELVSQPGEGTTLIAAVPLVGA